MEIIIKTSSKIDLKRKEKLDAVIDGKKQYLLALKAILIIPYIRTLNEKNVISRATRKTKTGQNRESRHQAFTQSMCFGINQP